MELFLKCKGALWTFGVVQEAGHKFMLVDSISKLSLATVDETLKKVHKITSFRLS